MMMMMMIVCYIAVGVYRRHYETCTSACVVDVTARLHGSVLGVRSSKDFHRSDAHTVRLRLKPA